MNAVSGLGAGKSDEWMTPPEVFEALGETFDLDVAAPPQGGPFVPATRHYSSDALDRPWSGFIWMNPPFGGRNALVPWMGRFFDHGCGIALTPDRASAPWFKAAWLRCDAVLFGPKTPFRDEEGRKRGSPAFGTALWASGRRAVAALERAEGRGFGFVATRLDTPAK